jgi:hypothetical protein
MVGWRLVMPYLPLAAAAAVVGWSVALAGVAPRIPIVLPLALLVAVVALGAEQTRLQRKFETITSLRAAGYAQGHEDLARWLCREGHAKPGDAIALMDIGIVGYRCIDHRILDITGLTDRFIAKQPGSFLKKRYSPAYVFAQEPRFLVLTLTAEGWWTQPPPAGTRFHYWSPVELRISRAPEFEARYVHRRDPTPGEAEDWLAAMARRRGAVRIFEHAYPEAYYLLLAFESRAEDGSLNESR